MGFNLDCFFKDLISVLDDDLSDFDKLNELNKVILAGYVYARECGQIEGDSE